MNIDRLDWDDLKLFLAVSTAGSVRGAARDTGLSINTVRARLSVMEHLTGAVLVDRSTKGLIPTQAGLAVRAAAERMRTAADASHAQPGGEDAADQRTLRLAITEGLATYWLMPHLAKVQRAHPDILLQVRTDARAADMSLSEVDLALHLRPGDAPGYNTTTLGTLHLMPFASPAYLAEHGTPASFQEWRSHRLVWQDWEPQAVDVMPLFIADDAPSRMISMITSSTPAQVAALHAGVGLGFLPTYMAQAAPDLRPVDFGMQFRRTIYMAVRQRARSAALPVVQDVLRSAFSDPDLFGEEFKAPAPTA